MCRFVCLGEVLELFIGVLYNYYVFLFGFCFDEFCNDELIMVIYIVNLELIYIDIFLSL